MEEQLNEHNSLQLIESMINRAKNNFSENGTLYLFWGIIILFCCLVQFVLMYYFEYRQAHRIWVLSWLAVGAQFFIIKKKRKLAKVHTYTGDIIKYVWLVFMACLLFTILLLIYFKAYNAISPAILILYGMPTILVGVIIQFRPLVTGGVICWALVIPTVLAGFQFQVLFIAAGVIAGWIMPGIALRKKYYKQFTS